MRFVYSSTTHADAERADRQRNERIASRERVVEHDH